MNEVKVQRNYKDTIFRMLFRDKENLLSLYNALNRTNYTDVLQKWVNKENLYSSTQIMIPAPRFVVFYNGTTYQPERQILKLSDAYEKKQENPELELMVTVYNINHGCNDEIMDACGTLKEYAMYVEQVRIYAKQIPLAEAVEKAVDYCIKAGILSEFLRMNRSEAIAVSIYEYDEELHFQTLRKEGMDYINRLNSILLDMDRFDDLKRAVKDKAYQEQLMIELLPEGMQDI